MNKDAALLDKVRWGRPYSQHPRQLIVLCHGIAADADQMGELAGAWAEVMPDAAFVAPQAPFRYAKRASRWFPLKISAGGRQWYGLRGASAQASDVLVAACLLDRFVDAELEAANLPPDAYALAGFSQGAMMALFVGLRRAVRPRAIIAFSGGLLAPGGRRPEIRNHPPVLLIHGEADDVVPASKSRDAEQALREQGVPVEALFRPALGHAVDAVGVAAGVRLLRGVFSPAGRQGPAP